MAQTDDAGEGRLDHRVRETGLDLRHRRFGLGQGCALCRDPLRPRTGPQYLKRLLGPLILGRSDFERRLVLVQKLAAHRTALEQVPRPLDVAPRVAETLLGGTQRRAPLSHLLGPKAPFQLGQQGAGGIHLRLGGAAAGEQLGAIEPGQLGPAHHPVPLANGDLLDATRHLEPEVGFGRLDGARSFDRRRALGAQQGQRDRHPGGDDDDDDDGQAWDALHRAISRFSVSQAESRSPTTRTSSTRAAICRCRASISADLTRNSSASEVR